MEKYLPDDPSSLNGHAKYEESLYNVADNEGTDQAARSRSRSEPLLSPYRTNILCGIYHRTKKISGNLMHIKGSNSIKERDR